jgi:hypothetical protein
VTLPPATLLFCLLLAREVVEAVVISAFFFCVAAMGHVLLLSMAFRMDLLFWM